MQINLAAYCSRQPQPPIFCLRLRTGTAVAAWQSQT